MPTPKKENKLKPVHVKRAIIATQMAKEAWAMIEATVETYYILKTLTHIEKQALLGYYRSFYNECVQPAISGIADILFLERNAKKLVKLADDPCIEDALIIIRKPIE